MVDAYSEILIPELPLYKKGKVREVYEIEDKLLIVVSDRISAFDYVLPSLIPDKGKILTQLSKFWFDFTSLVCPNHLLTDEIDEFPPVLLKHK
ncbi:MAG TPA: phosphoribosylaminoimidazolesuccinocarboxamide synthase, partial [Candidatus Aminicenantes bacterium]|nr:phosphoribosylaminoimidazolesuccinocarboxamide synthase [Candidatus Aminicenantes bacterium]